MFALALFLVPPFCIMKDLDGLREQIFTTYINEVVSCIPIFDRTWDRERQERNRQIETEYYRNLHRQLEARRHEQF